MIMMPGELPQIMPPIVGFRHLADFFFFSFFFFTSLISRFLVLVQSAGRLLGLTFLWNSFVFCLALFILTLLSTVILFSTVD